MKYTILILILFHSIFVLGENVETLDEREGIEEESDEKRSEAVSCYQDEIARLQADLSALRQERAAFDQEKELWRQLGKHALLREIASDLSPQIIQLVREEVASQFSTLPELLSNYVHLVPSIPPMPSSFHSTSIPSSSSSSYTSSSSSSSSSFVESSSSSPSSSSSSSFNLETLKREDSPPSSSIPLPKPHSLKPELPLSPATSPLPVLFSPHFFGIALCSAALSFGVELFLNWRQDQLLSEADISSFATLSSCCTVAQMLLLLLMAVVGLGDHLALLPHHWSAVNPTVAQTLGWVDADEALNGLCLWLVFVLGRRFAALCIRAKMYVDTRQYADPFCWLRLSSEALWLVLALHKFEAWYLLSVLLFSAEIASCVATVFSLWPFDLIARIDTVRIFTLSSLVLAILHAWRRGIQFQLGAFFSFSLFFLAVSNFIEIVKLASNHNFWHSRLATFLFGSIRRRFFPQKRSSLRSSR